MNESDASDLKEYTDAASRFLNRFDIVKLLCECGAYKEKCAPVGVSLLYIFNLMFSPMSMYYALLVDDTPLPKCGKTMKLVSKYFNHVAM